MTTGYADVPLWAAIVSAAFILLGAGLSLVGAVGVARLSTFYDRIHAPTLATSWGAGGMVMGSMIFFTAAEGRPVIHEILIGVFVTVTTPVTLMMLGRAAVYRDRSEQNPGALPKETSVDRADTVSNHKGS
ncbi:monovalent cation/H(+) antiporter subunit G [Aliihoeflea sp. 40Bstr573]|uniref:monovalent cation/H(+) antiporter subunit G n=1 Tax=Aliihoeflea sp. 40Bstr573 TaxID=2696467 RepID=UPI002095B266|nr:monovalent cation/H(+) antiporter subunit G [Aliihoeflea sp. 40Bstr573]MCO6387415.1 cation:proton antiporter [Aliihoeflea sp. 40Bstr573]